MRFNLIFLSVFFSLLIQAQEGSIIQTFQSPLSNKIEHAFLSNDNQTILAGDANGYVFFWRKEDETLSKILRVHNQSITKMAVSGDSKYFATTSTDNEIFLWDFETGKKTGELILGDSCTGLTFNRENNFLLYATENAVYKSPVTDFKNSVKLYQSGSAISYGAPTYDGKYFAISSGDLVSLLDATDGKVLSQTTTCSGLRLIESSANQLCTVCEDGTIQLFEIKDNSIKKKSEMNVPFSTTMKLLLLSEQKNALFTSESGSVQIWDWASNKLFQADGLPKSITALNSAGELILTGDNEGLVALCKAPSARGEMKEVIEQKIVSKTTAKSLDERQVYFQESVEVQLQQLDVYVWDDENVDGDTISLSLNGEWILENHLVTKEKKKITLALVPDKKNTLVLYAENLGTAPPNTAVISFNDGNKERTLTLSSDLKRCDAVNFILKK